MPRSLRAKEIEIMLGEGLNNVQIADQLGIGAQTVGQYIKKHGIPKPHPKRKTMKEEINSLSIYCCGCQRDVNAQLTGGGEIYPHRTDLAKLSFWKCMTCSNYVGCHKSGKRNKPLGNIPTAELRAARGHIHAILDPLWYYDIEKRKKIYAYISQRIGHDYHTATIKSVEEAREVYKIIKEYKQ